MFCNDCGAPNPDVSRFCARCGRDMHVVDAPPPAPSRSDQPPSQTPPATQHAIPKLKPVSHQGRAAARKAALYTQASLDYTAGLQVSVAIQKIRMNSMWAVAPFGVGGRTLFIDLLQQGISSPFAERVVAGALRDWGIVSLCLSVALLGIALAAGVLADPTSSLTAMIFTCLTIAFPLCGLYCLLRARNWALRGKQAVKR